MQYPPISTAPHIQHKQIGNNKRIKLSVAKIFFASFLFIFLISIYFLFPLYQKVWITLFSPTFSIIVLPDTQKYSADDPELFCKQTKWIVDNIQKKNIVFVSHVGDIVDGWKFKKKQWEDASKCLETLDGHIPYSIVPGNHDTETGSRDSGLQTYNTYFPVSRYSSYDWYKGNRRENANSYQMLKIWGIEFLFIGLEVEPSNNSIDWAKDIVEKHPHAYTAITTHKYLPDNGLARDKSREYSNEGNTGEDIWKKLIEDNCSIKLVWSGHFHGEDGEAILTSTNNCGYKVYQTMQNYQTREKGGNGKLRIYTFNPKKKEIRVQTYSPVTDSFEIDASSDFTIPFMFEYKDSWWRIKP
jgi:hypothetical protein